MLDEKFKGKIFVPRLASYPGPPMFFNVAREKSGRPGRSGDVIGRSLGRGYIYPAYSPTPFTTWP